jgi:alkanesulfonate monooxygenase
MNQPRIKFCWWCPSSGATRYLASGELEEAQSLEYILRSATAAEKLGFDSLLLPVSPRCVDPFVLTAYLAHRTERLNLLAAVRPGMWNPVQVARVVASLDMVAPGRIGINLVEGNICEANSEGDSLDQIARSTRQAEFCEIVSRLWAGERANSQGEHYQVNCVMPPGLCPHVKPEIFVSGHTPAAIQLAFTYGSHILWFGESLSGIQKRIAHLRETSLCSEKESPQCGIAINIIARRTRAEAIVVADKYISRVAPWQLRKVAEFNEKRPFIDGIHHLELEKRSYWADEVLWYGAARGKTHQRASLVGSYCDVAERLIQYARSGVSFFVLTGDPNGEEVRIIGENVLPLVRSAQHFKNEVTTCQC